MKNTIIARLEMIFSQTDIDRITVKDTVPKNLQVMVDVHGMKCCESKKFINNIMGLFKLCKAVTVKIFYILVHCTARIAGYLVHFFSKTACKCIVCIVE